LRWIDGRRYIAHMGILGNAFKDGRIVGGILAVGIMATVGVGAVAVASADQQPAAVVQTADPALTIDLTATDANGLAAEQEAEGAAAVAAEQARLAAEAEAARVSAEQAAAEEAARIAAEQAAAEEAPAEDVPADDGVPEGAWPLPWIPSPDPVNAPDGGRWDMSGCFTYGETINGQPYCMP